MDLLQRVSILQKYEAGDTVVEAGSLNTTMYIIMEGVATLNVCESRRDTVVASKGIGKGAFFGGLGLTDTMYRYVTCTAEEPTLVMHIPMKHVEEQRNFDRINGEAFYQSLCKKADGFSDEIRTMELEAIRQNYGDGQKKKYRFLFDTPYADVLISDQAEKYMLKRTVKCPVCRHSFETETIRTSRLLLKSRGEYFINEYKEVEPLWLDVLVCPHCYYAERLQFFEKLYCLDIKKLYKMLLDIKSSVMFRFSRKRTAEEVINAYLIYEKCLLAKNVGIKEKAKGAILMAELYRRMDSPGLAKVYYDKAFKYYHDLIAAGVVDVDEMQMQQLYIILGKLYERQGMTEEAVLQYKNAKTIFGVEDKRYTNIADSYLMNLTQP